MYSMNYEVAVILENQETSGKEGIGDTVITQL